MTDREKVIKALEKALAVSKAVDGEYIYIACGEAKRALELLKEQEPVKPKVSEWLEDSDPGQEYGTTWACAECGCSIHERTVWNPYRAGFKYCPFCGDRMVLKRDD